MRISGPISTYPSLHHLSPLKTKNIEGVDFIIYRELTGGIYFGKKGNECGPDECASMNAATAGKKLNALPIWLSSRLSLRRKKLTLVDKANVLETSRLWRKVVQDIAKGYPEVTLDFLFVDNAAMQIIVNPKQFDVILTENMFGDILSDEASVISGSLGLLPSASVGKGPALFEPIHGSYPQAAGKDIANPLGSILSAAMMLDHFELYKEAELVREAVEWTLTNGFVTKDIDPVNFYFTTTIGELISDYLVGKISGSELNQENIALGSQRSFSSLFYNQRFVYSHSTRLHVEKQYI